MYNNLTAQKKKSWNLILILLGGGLLSPIKSQNIPTD